MSRFVRPRRPARPAPAERLEPRVLLATVPAGDPFRIDPGGGVPHGTPAVSADADGDFVAVWQAEREFGEIEVYARRYDAVGNALGPVFQVNQSPTGLLSAPDAEFHAIPDVAMDADGDFVAVWQRARATPEIGTVIEVYARRFESDGAALGDEFRVNTASFSRGAPTAPVVAAAPGGEFVVAWDALTRVGGNRVIFARRFDAAGMPRTDEFQVNANTEGPRYDADVAVGADGRFVVTWSGVTSSSDYGDAYGRLYSADGSPVADEFVLSSGDYGINRGGAAAAMDAAGGFVATFIEGRSFESLTTYIVARRFGPDGLPLARTFAVSAAVDSGLISKPNVAGSPDGRFVVTWTAGPTAATGRVEARWYDAAGFARSGPVEVVAAGSAAVVQPGVAMDVDGNTVIVWRGPAGAGSGMFGRRYVEDGRPTIATLSDEPDPVLSGRPVTLTAEGVSAPGGAVGAVLFYLESNFTPGYQAPGSGVVPDAFIGSDSTAPYTLVFDTAVLAAGTYTYYAVARDAAGVTGDPASTTNTVFEGPPAPPAVAAVYVNGTRWSDSFRQALRDAGVGSTDLGYAVPAGAGQLAPIPFAGIDLVSVRFTEDVVVTSGMLTVRSANGSRYSVGSIFVYDEQTFTATWLTGGFTADRVRIELPSGPDGVHDFSGAPLDGEWADGADNYPSGDGTPGGDFHFGLNVLVGDADRNGRVDVRDWMEVRRRRYDPAFPNPARYSVFADVDGSGQINNIDLFLVRGRIGRSLPGG